MEEKENEEIKEVIVEKKSGFNYAEVIVIMIISLIVGGVVGSFINVFGKNVSRKTTTVTTTDNKKVNIPSGMEEFINTYQDIVDNYYGDINTNELLEAGISGMLNYLGDDYSVYMNKDVTESFNEQVEGKYTGIGVEIIQDQKTNEIKINRVFADSPAMEAGMKPGDIFVSVEGKSVDGMSVSDLVNSIRKSTSKIIKIVVKRDGEEKKFNLTLKEVNIESVETKMFEKNNKKVGYIRLGLFANNSYAEFSKKLVELEKKGIDSLIIDVRSNSGGYLSTANDIASMFLPKGKIIYQLDTKGVVEQIFDKTKEKRDYKVVVLIDGASASASEILAAAMQESYGATIIGTKSYGKGTVQTAYQLKSGASIKYTIQKWLTPDGNWINEKGVQPDIELEFSEEFINNPIDDNDNQLQRAIEELSK